MASLAITMLGAGQDVGRSCVVVTFPTRRIVFDCGAHCGFVDHRRYPDLQLLGDPRQYDALYNEQMKEMGDIEMDDATGRADYVSSDSGNPTAPAEAQNTSNGNTASNSAKERNIRIATCMKNALRKTLNNVTDYIDCAIISHFHLDHVGALPFLTEHLGYKGPVFMTYPTRGLAPILLRDSVQVVASKFRSATEPPGGTRGVNMLLNRTKKRKPPTTEELGKVDPWGYTLECVADSLGRARVMQLRGTQKLGNITITPYYAGHVLGAAMFHVECDGISVLYTGDFNMSPDKHLGPAHIPSLKPDVLICESTYASVVRQPRRSTEMELCTVVHDCLLAGGKVLIPVFAVGRAQELAIILDNYWSRLQLQYPIYFGGGLSERATNYYKLHSTWTDCRNLPNLDDSPFLLNNVLPFDNNLLNDERPMVLFATPGMVHSGLSLKACKLWAPNPKNLIVIPGYAVQGTVGNKLISGEKVIQTSTGPFEIKCKVRYLSFSAHADSAGILRLIKQVQPKHLVLVHGEYDGMKKFAKHVAMETIIIKPKPSEETVALFHYPELLVESSGLTLSVNSSLEDTLNFGIKELEEPPDEIAAVVVQPSNPGCTMLKMENDGGEMSSTLHNLFDDVVKNHRLYVISRNHLAALIRGGMSRLPMAPELPLHRIKHRQSIKCSERRFMETTEFIASLVQSETGYFVEDVPIHAETLDSGEKVLRVGTMEARHGTNNILTLQWYNHDMQPNSVICTMVSMLQRLADRKRTKSSS
ncbi:Integrator complex subunit 11 [Babesia sp. Xinjiang]|uniref:Integrator complex subunit 11 n=1 Tax=Babesia sp. Xinjiang TaxID=462227 RepID=UPI000A22237A|nr:Integrator complex subunit 11 [Babesia sp. Xinjiang]XP_028871601.1 Integrator complex subunit 11 [Babesia sp. Xinjiang]ORM41098.1 Integrator complex subunit 11 [Babesia sp. Xinjiang]ORM41145.1 Integrator complex subunit 11 [Babesia sp. Xinjiang]